MVGSMEDADATTVYHTRHTCGHSAYWADASMGMMAASHPCPWCGAATGTFRAEGDMISLSGILVFRALLPDGRVPWPSDRPSNGTIVVRHMKGNVCCAAGNA
jgi:hypothetical protein